MSATRFRWPGRAWIVLPVLAALVLLPTVASGQQPAGPPKRIVVPEFGKVPLKKVFTWLTEVTDIPLVANFMPTGAITFVPPNPPRTYTLPEVMDVINGILLSETWTQKYYLIRGKRYFCLVVADEKVDGVLCPRVTMAELGERGRTELVRVTIPFRRLNAAKLAREVKKQIGPVGDVVSVPILNVLVMWDTAGNLRRICRMLAHFE
jgi:hypothetical protein